MAISWDITGLFISAFLSATLLPGSSEALLLILLNSGDHDPSLLWLAATLGNTLGGLSSWLIGACAARFYPAGKLSGNPRFMAALQRLHRHGSPLLLLSWLPLIGDPLCLAAGWLRIYLPAAALFIFLGKGLRYGLLLTIPTL
jgi:membrane protein YqaA with SNARE-associated domain